MTRVSSPNINLIRRTDSNRYLRIIDRNKQIFFSDLNLILEGKCDAIILNKLIERDFKIMSNSNDPISNIEIIDGEGDNCLPLLDLIIQFNIPALSFLDYDKKQLIVDSYSHIEKNIILLPSDILRPVSGEIISGLSGGSFTGNTVIVTLSEISINSSEQ